MALTSAVYGQVINTVAGGSLNNLTALSASVGSPSGLVQFNGNT